jgi:hypothetical protein
MPRWQNRELNSTTAHAVALMTLYIGATDHDDADAAALLAELLRAPKGAVETVDGLESLCAALLVLLELETGQTPDVALRRIGQMVAGYSGSTRR